MQMWRRPNGSLNAEKQMYIIHSLYILKVAPKCLSSSPAEAYVSDPNVTSPLFTEIYYKCPELHMIFGKYRL